MSTHRIIAPSLGHALALAEFINSEGGTASTISTEYGPGVLALATHGTVDAACLALSFGNGRCRRG